MAIAEFSKFAGILSAALSQHHLLGFTVRSVKLDICFSPVASWASQVALVVKNLPANAGDARDALVWEDILEKERVFVSGKFHGQRSLVSYSPWGHKESDTTE